MPEVIAPSNAIAFKSLSFADQMTHLDSVAKNALCHWGYPEDANLKLLNITENATYLVTDGENKMVMRVHRIDYASKESITTELSWITHILETTDLNIVQPIRSMNGTLVETIITPKFNEERHVVCFEYVEGKAPKDSNDDNESIGGIAKILNVIPNKISVPVFKGAAMLYHRINQRFPSLWKNSLKPADITMYQTLGEIAAKLHENGKTWEKPWNYERITWDYDSTFKNGWNNYYGVHYQQMTDWYSKDEIDILDECSALIKKRLERYGTADNRYGMIHSDLRMSNLLQQDKKITVLDFDDCGEGWFMYDVACICGFMEHRPDLHLILEAIIDGYERIRPVSKEEAEEVSTFIMMRRIGLTEAIMYHLDITVMGGGESAELIPEVMAFYAKGTVILAKEYLAKFMID